VGRLESISATKPHLIVTTGGVAGDCELTFVDGIVDDVLSIVNAAEKLMGLAIAGVCGKYLMEAGGCSIDTTLLQKGIGLGCVGQEKAKAKEEEKRKGNADTGQRSRDEHD